MQVGSHRCARIHKVLLLVCLLMILQNTVTISRQSYDIYQKSTELRRKHPTLLATDRLRRIPKLSNNSFTKRPSSENKTEGKWNITKVANHEIIQQETETAQPASRWKTEAPEPKSSFPKIPVAPVHARSNFTPVLILAYLRSGSSWLGNMVQQADETFYVFEPFKPYQHQSYYKVGSVCFNNNTCRTSDISTDRHGFAVFTLEQLFNCRFERVTSKIVTQLTHGLNEGTQLEFKQCVKAVHNSTKCLNYLKRRCFESNYRIIKTIRISMSIVAKLANLVPGLKVIHLLRDPRAISHSRRNGHFSMSFDIISHSQNLCGRMDEDLDTAKYLKKEFHGKIVTVVYEALAEYPDTGIQFLYNFLKLPLGEETYSWMDMSSSGLLNNGYYKTYRKDSAQVAQRWRSKMTFNMTRIIDSYCGNLYSRVGYVAMKQESDLNDNNFLSRNTNPLNDESWFQ